MRPLNAVLADSLETLSPRQRLATHLSSNWNGRVSETNYYIELFNRWMHIHGKDIVWFGMPGDWDRVPIKDLNINSERAEAAFKGVTLMLRHWASEHAFRRHCYPEIELPWVHGKRKVVDFFNHSRSSIKPGMTAVFRAAAIASKIEKLEKRRGR